MGDFVTGIAHPISGADHIFCHSGRWLAVCADPWGNRGRKAKKS